MSGEALCLAAAAWAVERLPDLAAVARRLDARIGEAVGRGAQVLVLPEYAGMEAALAGAEGPADPAGWCRRAAAVAEDYRAICAETARRHGVWLLSGSMPAPSPEGLVNRAWFCTPEGETVPHDKQILTPWERANTPLAPGLPPRAMETPLGRIAVLICYDAEFPDLAAALAPDLLLVPSCTDALSGQTRVRNAARARALEQQCVAVHAPLVGEVAGCALIDKNRGRAAVCAPPDHPFPEDGLLAQTEPDTPGWAIATVPAGAVAETRSGGAVALLAHAKEAKCRAGAARSVTLSRHRP